YLFAFRSYDWCDIRHDASANPWSKCATKKPISRWNRVDKHLTASIGLNRNRSCHHDNVYFAKQLLKDGYQSIRSVFSKYVIDRWGTYGVYFGHCLSGFRAVDIVFYQVNKC